MPCQDELTAIRRPNDLDLAEEAAWTRIELEGWIATPILLMWLTELHRQRLIEQYGHDRVS